MRTTVTLDGKLVSEVLKMTAAKNKTKAVALALDEYIRRQKIDKLRALLGHVQFDMDAVEAFHEADRKRERKSHA